MVEPIPAPASSNPREYPRAFKVQDDEALLLKAEMDEKFRVLRRFHTQLEIATAEHTALKERMFLRLADLYPIICSSAPDGGVGIRQWENDLWYVGWDAR
jgi:hypothetical protein